MGDDGLISKIDRMRDEQEAQTQTILVLSENVQMLAAMISRLVNILTPEEKAGGGELAASLAALVLAVERQNRLLEDHTSVLTKFVRDIPAQVAAAVLDGTMGLLAVVRDLPGRVLTAVRDGLR